MKFETYKNGHEDTIRNAIPHAQKRQQVRKQSEKGEKSEIVCVEIDNEQLAFQVTSRKTKKSRGTSKRNQVIELNGTAQVPKTDGKPTGQKA